jgi:formylmethanofuran dehydrogenase subunit E
MSVSPTQYSKIRVLADSLIASCDGGMDQTDTIEALTIEESRVLDGMALECQTCNQWFAANEMKDEGGEYVCADCTK